MTPRDGIDELPGLAPSPAGVEICSCDEALALRRELASARARIAELEQSEKQRRRVAERAGSLVAG